MVCKNCGKEFEGKFCPECGTKVEEEAQELTHCPQCGTERIDNGKFCVNCGFNYLEPTQPVREEETVLEEEARPTESNGNKLNGKKFFGIFAKIYRWLLAGGMLFVGIVSLLCLTAPTITESFMGEVNKLCTGFAAIGGKEVDVPKEVVNASVMLLVVSLLALVYGGAQLFFALKKPYSNTVGKKKYVLWGIDGVISLILIILGAVVAKQSKSEMLADGKLGSGFAMCIVMGVFGLLFLVARIFYELKVFKWEDTGLSEEQIAKSTQIKEHKKLTKKQIMAIVLPVLTIAVLIAVIVPTVTWATNIFRIGKVDKINIGDSQAKVIKVLGEPYEKSDYRYEYFSKEYTQIADKAKKYEDDPISNFEQLAKLEAQLEKLTYQYICVEFDSDKKVTSVFFDANRCEGKEIKKSVKSYDVQGKTTIQQYETLNLSYKVKYSDGSLFKGKAINNLYCSDPSIDSVDWKDSYGNEYKIKIKINPITNLTSEIVTMLAGGDKSTLTEFEIAENITSIDSYAFSGCINLTNIVIPNSVTSIGSYAFDGCNNLITATMPTQAISYIPKSNLKTVVINGGAKIGDRAFKDCSSMTSIEIPSSVTSIGNSAFYGCSNLISIKIKDGLISIDSWAFENCSSLTSIEIPSSITSIASSAFYGCSNLKYNEYDNGLYLGNQDNLYVVLIKAKNSNISSCIINENTKLIYISAFNSCNSLTSIEMPSSVISIGADAFSYCGSLTGIYINDVDSWCQIDFGNFSANPLYYAKNLYLNNELVTELTIPSSVTSIGKYAFSGCNMTSIAIPSAVTSIGTSAFYECSSLISIAIPSSVTSIGTSAFYGCSSLMEVYITDIASWCNIEFNSSGANPLYYAKNLYLNNVLVTELTIPSSVTSIGDYAFYNCIGLTSIEIPSNVTYIGSYAFEDCSNLTSVIIPSGVTSIGWYAFYGCSALTIYCEVESQPNAWESNWNKSDCPVVWNCKNNEVAKNGNIYYVADDGVRYALKDGKATVVRQSKLLSETLTIPSSVSYKNTTYTVTSIDEYAFYGCSSLTSIEIHISIKDLGYSAFGETSSSLTILCEASSRPSGWSSSWNPNNRTVVWGNNNVTTDETYDYVIHNDKAIITKYKGSDTEITIPSLIDNKEVIDFADVFRENTNITSIKIPNSITSIDEYAFYGCSSLTSVAIPSSVTSIDFWAFSNCRNLVRVDITDLASWCRIEFGSDASNPLYYAKNLYLNNELVTELTIPSSVTSIGKYAFYCCSSLTSITIPNGVTSIGKDAFYKCSSNLTNITVNSNNAKYKSDGNCLIEKETNTLLLGCNNSTIPNGVTSIGDYAFYGCSGLTSISIPNGAISIGDYAFCDCSGLISISIPNGVTSIGSDAFYNCSSLTNIEIPSSIISIGSSAFTNCRSLKYNEYDNGLYLGNEENPYVVLVNKKSSNVTSYTINKNTKVICDDAFIFCKNLTRIEIPISVICIDPYAFSQCNNSLTIYCEASSKPSGWSDIWNRKNGSTFDKFYVVWGYKISDNQ